MKENTNYTTGSLIRETYDSNRLVDRKIIPECILNIEAWRELALQEKDLEIKTNIIMGRKANQTIIIRCTKIFGETKVVYYQYRTQ